MHRAEDVSTEIVLVLDWSGVRGAEAYDVYFGASSDPLTCPP